LKQSDLIPTTDQITVLLVDDEDSVRETTQAMLQVAAFSVETAEDGQAAINRYLANERFNVVLLDMSMPRLSGPETMMRLKEIDPSVKVIISTGFGLEDEAVVKVLKDGAKAAIQKPYRLMEIVSTIRAAAGSG